MLKIVFFFEHGNIPEIGTGHMYRVKAISEELKRMGNQISILKDTQLEGNDVLVIDHLYSQIDLIKQAKKLNIKVVLIDGTGEDAAIADISVSAFYNKMATYKGINYMAFPNNSAYEKYRTSTKSNSVFIGMGGFDANNHAEIAIRAVKQVGLNAVVAKSINHPNFADIYSNAVMFEEQDYYTAMRECVLGITAGGLTLFQALNFGLPCIAIPQYEHQAENISYVQHCCLPAEPNEEEIITKLKWLIEGDYYRNDLSKLAQHYVDGKGVKRICSLIESLRS